MYKTLDYLEVDILLKIHLPIIYKMNANAIKIVQEK